MDKEKNIKPAKISGNPEINENPNLASPISIVPAFLSPILTFCNRQHRIGTLLIEPGRTKLG